MKILITGSSGFIGTHLVRHLAELGHTIVGLDLNTPQIKDGLSNFIHGDIRLSSDVSRSLEGGVDIVINLAAKHYDWGITPDEYHDYNVCGSRCLLDGMEKAGVSKYLFYSTIAVYGERLDRECDEETPPAPNLPYGRTKLEAEEIAREWASRDPEKEVLVIRPCVVYGPRNFTNTFNLMKQIDSGLFLRIGRGDTIKAMCYVGNLVHATVQSLSNMKPGVSIYNYTDVPNVTVGEAIHVISRELGKRREALKIPFWFGLIGGYIFDIFAKLTGKNIGISSARIKKLEVPMLICSDKIRREGFQQEFSMDEGIRDMASWFIANFRNNPNPPVNRPY